MMDEQMLLWLRMYYRRPSKDEIDFPEKSMLLL